MLLGWAAPYSVTVGNICLSPSSLSDIASDVSPLLVGKGDHTKHTITLSKLVYFFWSEHCWKHLG